MQRHRYLLLKHAALAASLSLAAGSCSSDSGDDDAAGATGNVAANGTGSSAGSGNGGSGTGGSGGANANGGRTSGTTGGSASRGGSTSSGTGATTSGGSVNTAQCQGLPFDPENDPSVEACEGLSFEAEVVPVDMFIMMDRSVSMDEVVPGTNLRRWDALHDAIEQFVQNDAAQDIGAGMGFFGISGAADDRLDCSVDRYAEPTVGIGPLSETGPDLVKAMADTVPGGLTPTLPALQGAIKYAKSWASSHPGRATVAVLVTDGYPTQCQDPVSIKEIADAAVEGYSSAPSIRTYVIGLAAGFNLDNIAQAGGSRSAFLVDEEGSNVASSFTNALLNITNSKISCQYEMPESSDTSMEVDPKKVQIIYKPAAGGAEEVPKLDGAGQCDINPNGGWYYDNPANPSVIKVCPCTCSRFQAGEVNVRVGCEPRIGIR